jgi:hypothetical protein
MRVGLWLIVFLTWLWKVLVALVVEVLSAEAIMASLELSFVFIGFFSVFR